MKWNEIHQHFLHHRVTPQDGNIQAPTLPGLGMELDPTKIEAETEPW